LVNRMPGATRPVRAHNRFYAALLKDDMSGALGEMTAMTQVMYHAFLLKKSDPKLSGLLARIARDDMRHFELLGETSAALGGNPVYRLGRTQDYWHAGLVKYGRDLPGRLADDITLKEAAVKKYNYHLRRVRDPALRALIREIIADEEEHAKLLGWASVKYSGDGRTEQTEKRRGTPLEIRKRTARPVHKTP